MKLQSVDKSLTFRVMQRLVRLEHERQIEYVQSTVFKDSIDKSLTNRIHKDMMAIVTKVARGNYLFC